MNWEKLDLHLENLIPGIVLLSLLATMIRLDLGPIGGRDALLAMTFVATAYMLGAVGNVLARLLLDYVSRKTIRAMMFRLFLDEKLQPGLTSRQINRRYSEVITAGLTCGNQRVETEVAKRRQTCRLLRSTLVPAWLIVLWVGIHYRSNTLTVAAGMVATYISLLFLYAYAEATIFQEGYRGEQIKKSASVVATAG